MKSKILALSKNEEFKNLLKMKKISNRYVNIFFGQLKNKNNKKLNISFVTKKKIGNAVKRNYVKRILRSIILKNKNKINKSIIFEIIPKKRMISSSFAEIEADIIKILTNKNS